MMVISVTPKKTCKKHLHLGAWKTFALTCSHICICVQVKYIMWNSNRLQSCRQPCIYAGICGATHRYSCHEESRKLLQAKKKHDPLRSTRCCDELLKRVRVIRGNSVLQRRSTGNRSCSMRSAFSRSSCDFFVPSEISLMELLCRFATESHIYTLKLYNKL